MRTHAASIALVTLSAVLFAMGCGITVIVPSETGAGAGEGGEGGAPAAGGLGGEIATPTTTPGACASTCSVSPGNQTCECVRDCDGVFPPDGKASCAPIVDLQGNHKIECVCTIDQFSGVCFEKNEAALCDFQLGCCAKYFSGK